MCESRRDDKARRVRRAFAQLTGAIFDRDRTLEGKHTRTQAQSHQFQPKNHLPALGDTVKT